jgi:SAM-dependent methyltransferase
MSKVRFLSVLIILAAVLAPLEAVAQEEAPPLLAYPAMKEKLEAALESGKYDEAVGLAEEVNEIIWPLQWEAMYSTARACALAGDRRKAYEYLFRAVDSGYWDAKTMMEDDAFAAIHEEKLFRKLASSARANGYIWMLEREEREEFQKPAEVMKAFELRPGMKVADVGCGSGYFTVKVAGEIGPEGHVWAIDAWQDMLDYLDRRLQIEGLENVDLVKVERDDPMIPKGQADLILMVDVYHYIKERTAYAEKLRDGLAPGGRLIVVDYIPKPIEERPWGPPPSQHLPEAELTGDLEKAGLRKVKQLDFLPEQYFVVYQAE